ncbi:hypothetical protein QVD17_39369 [Tagetes erecta]|uniref:Uncharacterized protein n=1 Tax=Tagetes erecta TaxID=13708 RepID=A0AAD8JQF9_TARER|nr:hypothetical protein QVD17_39369 [Tagetes erecta]
MEVFEGVKKMINFVCVHNLPCFVFGAERDTYTHNTTQHTLKKQRNPCSSSCVGLVCFSPPFTVPQFL